MLQLPAAQPLQKPPNRGRSSNRRRASNSRQTSNSGKVPSIVTDRQAAVAIEYALIGSLVAVIAIGGLTLFGDSASGLWTWLTGELTPAMTP